jgi:hypothetical protein
MVPMPERQLDAWGIPLWEAIERWTPREVWQRYRQIAQEEVSYFFVPPGPTPLHQEASRLRAQIERILTDQLRRGELIVSGLRSPFDRHTERWDVPSELWWHLKLDVREQIASGEGLRVVNLRFRTAIEAKSEQAPAVVEELTLPPNKPGGRPSIMPMIEAEMRRRADMGLIEGSLRREAEALALWVQQQQFTDAHVPKPESIERKLGRVYKELKRIKRPDKLGDKR